MKKTEMVCLLPFVGSRENIIYCHNGFDGDFSKINPEQITQCDTIKFDREFGHQISNLPEHIEIIDFSGSYSFKYAIKTLPKNIKKIYLGDVYNKILRKKILNNIEEIYFGDSFNSKIDGFPLSLRVLKFGYYFNQPINNLPNNIIELSFGRSFDQPINNLPQNLKKLIIGELPISLNCLTNPIYNEHVFNKQIDCLPPNLEILILSKKFNQTIDNLPVNLKQLTFGNDFNQKLDNLPPNLKQITLGEYFDQNIDNLPNSIVDLFFDKYSNFNQNIGKLPQNIEVLKFNDEFNQQINNYPQNLKIIEFGQKFNQSIDNLPPNIVKIIFSKNGQFNQKINIFPQNLRSLILNKKYNHVLDNLPNSLQILEIGIYYTHDLLYLNDNIQMLTINQKDENYPEVSKLPKSLISLELKVAYWESMKLFDLKGKLPNLILVRHPFSKTPVQNFFPFFGKNVDYQYWNFG
jgi:hypothetical protein